VSVLSTLRFSREFKHVFPDLADYFEDLCVASFWVSFIFQLLAFCRFLFLRAACFRNFMYHLLFQFAAKRNLGMLLCKFAWFGLVYPDLQVVFVFKLFVFCFVQFSYEKHFGHIFR